MTPALSCPMRVIVARCLAISNAIQKIRAGRVRKLLPSAGPTYLHIFSGTTKLGRYEGIAFCVHPVSFGGRRISPSPRPDHDKCSAAQSADRARTPDDFLPEPGPAGPICPSPREGSGG